MSIDVERHEVRVLTLNPYPSRKLDCAEYGMRWVKTRVFPSMRHRDIQIRWFDGTKADYHGLFIKTKSDSIWVNLAIDDPRRIVEIAAHETVHAVGFDGEEVPTLIGRLVAAHWADEIKLAVHMGSVRDGWIPEELKTMDGRLPRTAVLLQWWDGNFETFVNDGAADYPAWRHKHLSLVA